MENATTTNVVLNKKLDNYGWKAEDFVAPQELTVTITLGEYRDLVAKVTTREKAISDANADKYQRESENKALRQEVSDLKAKLYELMEKGDENNGREAEDR